MKLLLSTLLLLSAAAPQSAPPGPGPEHARLVRTAGTWDATLTLHTPDGKSQRSRGRLTRTALAGMHLVDEFTGELMGMPMQGRGLAGYDPTTKQHFAFWTDSLTPSPMTLHGDYDAASRELVLVGNCYGPSGKLEPCRTVTHFPDDDHMSWMLFSKRPDGADSAILSIEYQRAR